ncbi:hypothetical protein GCM10007047_03900 [Cerasicoccus arenae]|uniref:ABC transmembrane type-2 domain-containing protein n=2 Tax=Cerasicoccus arenae TaxID=424488 RepID=A0A8J3D993_9BACT|nr:hypothetical protein GCM10007047_03900 [Cerasicoccus arenae]
MRKNASLTWELATRMFIRDMRAMYRQSILGYIWIFLPPIANTLIWVYLNSQDVIKVDTGGISYPAFVLTGNLLWTAFNATLTSMLNTVNESRALLSKINFPHEALLLTALGKSAVNAMLPLVILIPVLPFYVNEFHATMLLFPLGVIVMILFGATIAILLLPIATLYGDVSRGVQLILKFGFFVTPVVYPLPAAGLAKFISDVNPVTPLLVTSRSWLLGEGPIMLQPFILLSIITLIALCFAILAYKIAVPYLIERLSS